MTSDHIRIRCTLCDRFGQYPRQRFFDLAGTDNPADALVAFAKRAGCKRAAEQRADQIHDRCQIRYEA